MLNYLYLFYLLLIPLIIFACLHYLRNIIYSNPLHINLFMKILPHIIHIKFDNLVDASPLDASAYY